MRGCRACCWSRDNPSRITFLKTTDSGSARRQQLPTALQRGVGFMRPPESMLGFYLIWSCASLKSVFTATVSPCIQGPRHALRMLFAVDVDYPGAYWLLLWWSLRRGLWIGHRGVTEIPIYIWALHTLLFSASWPVVGSLLRCFTKMGGKKLGRVTYHVYLTK